jgi:hypothetical protein
MRATIEGNGGVLRVLCIQAKGGSAEAALDHGDCHQHHENDAPERAALPRPPRMARKSWRASVKIAAHVLPPLHLHSLNSGKQQGEKRRAALTIQGSDAIKNLTIGIACPEIFSASFAFHASSA